LLAYRQIQAQRRLDVCPCHIVALLQGKAACLATCIRPSKRGRFAAKKRYGTLFSATVYVEVRIGPNGAIDGVIGR